MFRDVNFFTHPSEFVCDVIIKLARGRWESNVSVTTDNHHNKLQNPTMNNDVGWWVVGAFDNVSMTPSSPDTRDDESSTQHNTSTISEALDQNVIRVRGRRQYSKIARQWVSQYHRMTWTHSSLSSTILPEKGDDDDHSRTRGGMLHHPPSCGCLRKRQATTDRASR
jgi:hypothetical protein